MFKKTNKTDPIAERINELEAMLKSLDPTSEEFEKVVSSLNLLKIGRERDQNALNAKKDQRRKTINLVLDTTLKGLSIGAGTFICMAVYSFDTSGNPATSKLAGFAQQYFVKKFIP